VAAADRPAFDRLAASMRLELASAELIQQANTQ
jgi:hypothetical protein